jgi:hypothetical protein
MSRGIPSDRVLGGGLLLALAAMVGYVVLAVEIGEGFAIPTMVLATIGGTIVLRGPVGQALAHRLHEGTAGPPEELMAEVDELRQRVGELEERLDFTERLLTAQRQDRDLTSGHLAGDSRTTT